ncbi:hypothetical protein, partial [Stenotrophomonas maltophilia]|uniref:hypothetical protein n=1 Tax=Stenotrophomonas maltophilia TaxID=40324 RepID=UPI0019534CE9
AIPATAAAEGERIVLGERRLFHYRREALLGQKAQLAERIAQLLNEIAGLEEQRTAKTAEAELIRKELVGVT